MFKPISLYIGLRYTRAKRRNHFISFISLMSMIGIALGVIVLITVLSVMNGFDREIKNRVFGMVPAVTVGSIVGNIENWQEAKRLVYQAPGVTDVAPFVSGEVLLTSAGHVLPALITGINPEDKQRIVSLKGKMVQGQLHSLAAGQFGIILGQDLADRLELTVGDKVVLVTPTLSPGGVAPRIKRFTVSGVFRAGTGFGFDSALAFINLNDAQKLFELGNAVSGLQVTIQDVYAAGTVSTELMNLLGPSARVDNWTETFGAFFRAISMEKTMMFFILLLIIAVAVFNLVSTLVMVVNEKEPDIAILRTMGATPRTIMRIFMVQGALIGVVGTLIGVLGGVLLAYNVTEIVQWIEHVFHVQFISSNVYFVNYLPSEVQWIDVIKISVSALSLSFVATLYPAWRAARTNPVEALRYE